MSVQRPSYDEIAVVVRFTSHDSGIPEQLVDLMKAFPSVENAEAEAERLNRVASENPRLRGIVQYFVKIARYLPDSPR